MTKIRIWNPADGFAAQGDIIFVPLPADIKIATVDEIKPSEGRLIIQEGEVSGHHHVIEMTRSRCFRAETQTAGDPNLAFRDTRLRKAFAGRASTATARLYRDAAAVEALRRAGVLTRTDLAIGCLVVEGGAVTVSHEEHDGISVPPGRYYVGRQVESAGAEERMVAD